MSVLRHEEATIRSYFSDRHAAGRGRRLGMLLDLVAQDRLPVSETGSERWDALNGRSPASTKRDASPGKGRA